MTGDGDESFFLGPWKKMAAAVIDNSKYIMLDEANYPITRLFCEKPLPAKHMPFTDKLRESIVNVKLASGGKINFDITTIEVKDGLQGKKDLCQNTIDTRDYFRIFTSINKVKTMSPKINAIVCLNAEGGLSDYCLKQCKVDSVDFNRDTCNKTLKGKLNGIAISNIDDVVFFNSKSTFDKFGNVIVSPPTVKHPYGCILYGNQNSEGFDLNFVWKPGCSINDAVKNEYKEKCSTEMSFDFTKAPRKGAIGDINRDLMYLLNTKFSQQSKIPVYTGWLEVGHIDEIIAFVKHSNGSQGFKMLVASPQKFIDIWKNEWEKDNTNDKCLFERPIIKRKPKEGELPGEGEQNLLLTQTKQENPTPVGFKMGDCDMRINQFENPELQPLIQFNSEVQTRILNKIKNSLKTKLGLLDSDIIDIPILYTGPDELFGSIETLRNTIKEYGLLKNYSIENEVKQAKKEEEELNKLSYGHLIEKIFNNFGLFHLSSNFINSVISDNLMISPFMHSNLPLKQYIHDAVKSEGGITDIFEVDTWYSVKYQHGGIHCFTNELRDYSKANEIIRSKLHLRAERSGMVEFTRKAKKRQMNEEAQASLYRTHLKHTNPYMLRGKRGGRSTKRSQRLGKRTRKMRYAKK
jgi:hypothetical protein